MTLSTTAFAQGTLASRPSASASNTSYHYLATDVNGGTLYQSNGTTWVQLSAAVLQGLHATASKGASYSIVAADNGTVFLTTAGSVVYTLPAPAVAGAGFSVTIKNSNQTSTSVRTNTAGVLIDGVDCSSTGATTGLKASYGAVRYVTDGTAWYTIAMNDNVTNNAAYKCSAYRNAAATITEGTILWVTWDTTIDDPQSMLSGTKITFPVAGDYLIVGNSGAGSPGAGTFIDVRVRVNGATSIFYAGRAAQGTETAYNPFSVVYKATASDYVEVGVLVPGSGTSNLSTGRHQMFVNVYPQF